jgi:hypothetical protein
VVGRQKHGQNNFAARLIRFRSIHHLHLKLSSFEQPGLDKCPHTVTFSLTLIVREKYCWNLFLKIKSFLLSEHIFVFAVKWSHPYQIISKRQASGEKPKNS